MAFNGQSIKFLQGTYDKIKTLTSSEVGAFYITNDTHEMFLGVEANKAPVALNRWVDVKENWAAINDLSDYKQHPGKIYYAKAENILCTYSEDGWVQINPDTNDDTSLSKVEISQGVKAADGKSVTYTLTFKQEDKDGGVIEDKTRTAELVITDELVTSLVVEVQVGLETTVTDGKATVKTIGAGSDENEVVVISGSEGVSITQTAEGFDIAGTTYDLIRGTDGVSVVLKDSDDAEQAVKFVGDKWIEAKAGTNKNEIAITHKIADSTNATNITTTTGTTTNIDVEERTFSALTNVKADNNGHIVSAEVTEFKVPNSVYELEATENKVGEIPYTTSILLKDGEGGTKSTANIKTAHIITVDGEEKIIANGGNLGSFYSASSIDSKLKAVDAMVYKGTVAGELALPTENVQIGHTYKASMDFTLSQGDSTIYVEKGDLLIANGTEGEPDANGNAYIIGTVNWDHIESGADTDTTYDLIGSNNKIILKNLVNDSELDFITVSDDDKYIEATVSNDILNISHKEVTVNNTSGADANLGYGGSVNVVTNVARDGAGHVSGIETTKVILPGADKIKLDAELPSIEITDANDGTKGKVVFADSDKIEVTGTVDGKILTVTAEHKEVEVTDQTPKDSSEEINLDGEGSFTVLKEVVYDEYGHITGYKKGTVTIAEETTYNLEGPALENNVVNYSLVNNNAGNAGSINLASDTLKYSIDNDDKVKIELVWGSFE